MIFRRLVLMTLAAALFMGAGACTNERMSERSNPSPYGQRDPYDPNMQRRQPGPWDMRQNQQQIGPSTWYGCPQQSPRCFPE
jgi:hypothetical protein